MCSHCHYLSLLIPLICSRNKVGEESITAELLILEWRIVQKQLSSKIVSRKKRQRPEYVDRVPKYIIRNQKLLLSDLQVNHDGYLGMFRPQPYDEEFAVCLLVAYGHIIGRRQGIKVNTRDRRLFDKTAEVLHQKQPNVKSGFNNPRGHYHQSTCAGQKRTGRWRNACVRPQETRILSNS